MEEGIIEGDRRMVIHAMSREVGNKHAQRLSGLKQVSRPVPDKDSVTAFVEVLAIIAHYPIVTAAQPG
jgi:hypothetical protein